MRTTRDKSGSFTPWRLDEVRERARVLAGDDDMALAMLADAAAEEIEQAAGIALARQRVTFLSWAPIVPPVLPVASDPDITINGEPAADFDTRDELATVSYYAGWSSLEEIPADLRLAVADHAAHLYDARGLTDARQGLSLAAARIVARYKRKAL